MSCQLDKVIYVFTKDLLKGKVTGNKTKDEEYEDTLCML